MKGKVKSSSTPAFMQGGKGKMAGKQSAGTQKAGQTASMGSGGGKFGKGGSGKMFGKQVAGPQKSGRTSSS